MSRYLRGAALAALTVAAACAVSSAASAQTYNRLVVFGDSLSDNGNLFAATFGTQPPPPFFQGRFSTGPVFTELLGFTLARQGGPVTGSINYAYGGARTDSSAFPPGMRAQLTAYTAAGGRFGAGDLVSILGGANNIFQGLPAAGASSNPTGAITPVALSAATDINFLVNSVATAGAGTILVTNLPKLSLTPQFRTSPAAPLADFAVGQFNGALLTGLNATAAARPGTNIIMMDLFKIGDVIASNPGMFGITNVTDACFSTTICTDPGYFYTDGVHPTALGHRLIARLANDYLYYGDVGAQSAVQGETAFRHREDGLEAASASLSSRAAWTAGTTISGSATADVTDTDARGVVGKATSDGYGASIALETGPSDSLRFGAVGSFRRADVKVSTLSFDLETMAFDVYAGWRSDAVFINATAGIANDDFGRISRRTSLAPIVHTGQTEGVSKGARIQGGLWLDMGGLAISPRVAASWVSSDVDGYAEQGPAAQYEYRDRTIEALSAEASLRAEGDIGPFGFFVEGGYRDNFDDNTDAVRVGILGNPAQVLSRNVVEPFGGQFLASAGVQGDWGPVRVDVGYRGRFGDHAESHMGGVTLTLPL